MPNPLFLSPLAQGPGGLSRHPNQKEKARAEVSEASRPRERILDGRRTGWLELVGAGRLVWPTGADTRRKHARRNVARFVASRTYRYTCTGRVHAGALACTYVRARIAQGERTGRGEDEGDDGGESAKYGPRRGTAHH